MSTVEGAKLRRPVSSSSILRHHPLVRYTELEGLGVLCRVDTRAVSTLSPSAAATWARFDGRTPLAAIGTGPELVELARRLRAVGALVDQDPADTDATPADDDLLAEAARAWTEVTLPGTWRTGDDGGGAIVELDPPPAADEATSRSITVAVGAGRVAVGDTPLDRIVLAGRDADDPPLGPVQALEQLAAAADRDELARPGGLDALADLVERVPVVGAPPDEPDAGLS